MQLSHSDQNSSLPTVPNQPASIASSLQQLFSNQTNVIEATRKLYHIRENFRRLALSILQLENAEFYVFHDSGRIEFHDFRENYITQLLEENDKKRTIQHLLANSSQSVEILEIKKCRNQHKHLDATEKHHEGQKKTEQFSKLFSTKQQSHKYIGQINKQNQKYSIICMFTFSKDSSVGWISSKIVQKLILVSMIEIEETEYDIVQFYSKELLDVLGMIVAESQLKMKRMLAGMLTNQTKLADEEILLFTLSQVIRKFFALQELEFLLIESLSYQEYRYELLERIRMYSKHLCEDNTIFMDFQGSGSLTFLSNNRKNSEFQPILSKLSLTGQLSIENIFQDNVTLQQHIRKSLEGQSKNKKLYEIENGIKARVIRSDQNEIQRIIIVVEDPPAISSQSSFSSSTFEGISSKKKKSSSNSDSISLGKEKPKSGSLIGSLERENPGMVAENGWLNLFMKDTELKRQNSNTMTKKKQMHFAKGQEGKTSSTSLNQLISADIAEQLKLVNIYSPDTNLLQLEPETLDPLVKKVFSELKFFKSLDCNKDFFDNFLFHLHEGYSLHDNPFHNFMHGVNVMHTCFLICSIPGNEQILSPIKIFSTVLSGLCHDVGHTGRTNSFEIASRSKKALTYNDLSDYNEIRKDIISNILYTDIKEHFPLIKKFKAIDFKSEPGKTMNAQDIRTLTGMITHTSDFGGSAKQFQICREWSRRVNIEFSSQYKQEEILGLPQTPFFKDLDVEPIMAKNEMGFLKVIVFPLYEALDDFYKEEGTLRKLRSYAEQNIKEWEKVHLNSVNVGKEEVKN